MDTLSKEYASVLEKLILNPVQVKEMGKRGRDKIVSRFTLDHMANDISRIS